MDILDRPLRQSYSVNMTQTDRPDLTYILMLEIVASPQNVNFLLRRLCTEIYPSLTYMHTHNSQDATIITGVIASLETIKRTAVTGPIEQF